MISQQLARFSTALSITLLSIFLLNSCAIKKNQNVEQRVRTLNNLATQYSWSPSILQTESFDLLSLAPSSPTNQTYQTDDLVIYIEGDGLAWKNRFTPSANPTPVKPIGLQLALKHSNNNVVYLARPCQYISSRHSHNCHVEAWTSGRYSEQVVHATNQAIDQLKHKHQSQSLTLIGFSGGATVALLVAARRQDVGHIVTLAGNLDPNAWTQHHHISPLYKSLTPQDYLTALSLIPQTHFIGERDQVIPAILTSNFVAALQAEPHSSALPTNAVPLADNTALRITSHTIPKFDHDCCWVDAWPQLLSMTDTSTPSQTESERQDNDDKYGD